MKYMPWIDIETTGLNPFADGMFEVGFIITDIALNEIERVSMRFKPTQAQLDQMIPYVHDMHVVNGLLEQVLERGDFTTLTSAEASLRKMMTHYFGDEKPPMCGSSVHFDRSFLEVYMPTFASMFSYRNIDVSTIKELAERFEPAVWARRPDDPKYHRALDDAVASINELRYYLETRFLGGFDPTTTGGGL